MRCREHELLRLPDTAVVCGVAREGRLHGHEPRQQPRVRLRPLRSTADSRGAQRPAPRAHGPPGGDRVSAGRRHQGGDRRVCALPVGAAADRYSGRAPSRQEGGGQRGCRHRDDARRCRRNRSRPRHPRHRDVPGREPGQRRRLLPRRRRRGGRRRDRFRPSRSAGHGVVQGEADRLLARELCRLQGVRARRAALDQRHSPGDACAATASSRAERSCRRGSSAPACRRSTRPRAHTGSCGRSRGRISEDGGSRCRRTAISPADA